MAKEDAKRTLIEFIINNQGCNAEYIVDGLKEQISRAPIFGALKDLVVEGIVQDRPKNRMEHRYFVDTTNPSILIPQQLENIVRAFRALLRECEIKRRDSIEQYNKAFYKMWNELGTKDANESTVIEFRQSLIQAGSPDVYYAPMVILRMIEYSIMEHTMVGWVNVIRDRDTLNQLISNVFSKLLY